MKKVIITYLFILSMVVLSIYSIPKETKGAVGEELRGSQAFWSGGLGSFTW